MDALRKNYKLNELKEDVIMFNENSQESEITSPKCQIGDQQQ